MERDYIGRLYIVDSVSKIVICNTFAFALILESVKFSDKIFRLDFICCDNCFTEFSVTVSVSYKHKFTINVLIWYSVGLGGDD